METARGEYEELRIIFNRLVKEYSNLTRKRINELYLNHSVDCGKDYARFILDELIYDGMEPLI